MNCVSQGDSAAPKFFVNNSKLHSKLRRSAEKLALKVSFSVSPSLVRSLAAQAQKSWVKILCVCV